MKYVDIFELVQKWKKANGCNELLTYVNSIKLWHWIPSTQALLIFVSAPFSNSVYLCLQMRLWDGKLSKYSTLVSPSPINERNMWIHHTLMRRTGKSFLWLTTMMWCWCLHKSYIERDELFVCFHKQFQNNIANLFAERNIKTKALLTVMYGPLPARQGVVRFCGIHYRPGTFPFWWRSMGVKSAHIVRMPLVDISFECCAR